MELSVTFLQTITMVIGVALCYSISKFKPTWWVYTFAYIVSVIVAWVGGAFLWGILFVSEDFTSAVTLGLSRSFLFALVGPGIGIFLVRKTAAKAVGFNDKNQRNG